MDEASGEYLTLKHARWLRPEQKNGKAAKIREGDRVTIVVTGLAMAPRRVEDNRTASGKGSREPLTVVAPDTYLVIDVEIDGAYVRKVERP
jgi:hypothetical protein